MVPASVMWRPTTIRPGNALWRMVQHNRQWLPSPRKLTPLWTHVRRPSRLRKHTPRNYDNDGRTRHLRWHDQCGTLRPLCMARRVAPGVMLVRSSMTL